MKNDSTLFERMDGIKICIKEENMENEMQLEMWRIEVLPGQIEFTEYEKVKQQAISLAEQIQQVEVNEENIKESKKMLAAVNKSVKELETRRITIKKFMMQPYENFESQVKEIVGIVKDADEIVRQQVRELEEAERKEKEETLLDRFSKRIVHYSFRDFFTFSDFLQPRHLNKTVSIESVEKEMVAFLEKISRDLKAIEGMENGKEVWKYYTQLMDLSAAVSLTTESEKQRKKIESYKAFEKKVDNVHYEISVFNEKDFKLVEMFMQNNDIDFLYEVQKPQKYLGGND